MPTHKVYLAVLWTFGAGLACAQTGLISTYAGNGFSGPFVDGVTATSATLSGPIGLAVDSNGNLFIADTNNSRIRKVSGGIMTTVAGGGTGADMLPALQAQLFNPCDVKVDSAGNLYISESCVTASSGTGGGGTGAGGGVMNRVRRVDAVTGIISTIAGGLNAGFAGDGGPPGSASLLNTPAGLAIDGSGNLYIADSGNNRIRRIDGVTGILTTVVGNGVAAFGGDGGLALAASLKSPSAVAVDAVGNLYIADAGNSRVRRVDAGTGIITTLAGTGSTFFNGDGIPATSANLGFPSALVVNGSGNLLLNDSLNNRVLLVDTSTGLIWTIAGNGAAQAFCCTVGDGNPATLAWLNVPAGIALSPMGPLFISEHAGQRVRQVALQNPLVSTAVNVTASDASVPRGSPLTFTAALSVMNGSPANVSIHFVEAGFGIGSAPLVNGSASFTTSSLQPGAHSVTGQYFGDSVFVASTSLPVSVTITAAQSSVALVANPSPAGTGQPVTLTATVTPSAATGSVNFFNGATSLGMANIGNGTATLTGVVLMAGSYSLTAQYSGNINLPSSTSPAIALTVKAFSSVALTSSVNPSTPGQAVTFTATVSPSTASGSVQFMDNGSVIGTYFFMSGPATFTISTLSSGTHSITTSYSGDANNASATSAALTQTVLVASSVVIASSQNPAPVGDPLTFTATVTPGNASGTVQFLDGTTVLGTGILAGGSASFTTSTLTQGTHYSITAVYSGDASNAGSTSAPLIQTMQAKVALTLASSLNPSTVGQTVTFTANTNPSAPGTVQFLDGTAVLATVPLSSGVAAFSTSTLTPRTHSITAAYGGATYYISAQSSALTETVNLIATTTALTSTPNPAPVGSAVTFIASVAPSAATGTVQFLDGTLVLGTGTVSNGSASFATSALTQGPHSITAVYSGDASNAGSTSAPLSQSVKLTAGLTLASSLNPSTVGQPVSFTANVNPAATGTVQFLDGAAVLATVPVSSGAAAFPTSALTQGTHAITAAYSGDTNYLSAQSSTLTETVNVTATTTALTSTPNPAFVAGAVSFSATVTPAKATGTVQFLDGATVLGTGTLSNGSASFNTSALTQGTHSITAVYAGDTADAGSTSAVLSQSMKLSAGMTAGLNPSPGVAGQNVTLTANVIAAATGTVTFTDDGTTLATVAVASGTASYSTTTLSQGPHTLGISYSGDSTYMSQSSTVPETILGATSITVTSNANPAAIGQSIIFTAIVTPAAAAGNVQFYDGSTSVAVVALSGGTASYSTSGLTPGNHSITANYLGSSGYAQSFSTTFTQAVKTSTSVALTSTPNPAVAGSVVSFSATVTPATATGTVQFFDGTTLLGINNIANGSTSFNSVLPQGTRSITAVYIGDATNAGSTSAVVSQSMKLSAGMTTGLNPSPAVTGQNVTLTANVNASATGTVTFTDGGSVLATVAVVSGTASYSTTTLAQGSHTLGITYSGDSTYMSQSTTVPETMLGATSITVASNANPAASGQSITFTATVTPAAATGTVQFYDGQTSLVIVALSGGTANYSTTALTAGTHSITANYLGNSAYGASFSNTLAEAIKTNTSVALASSWNPSLAGGTVTFNATVTPATATGAVQFFDGSTLLGTGALSNGSASLATAALTQGAHSITAVYGGDSADAASTSAVLSQSVQLNVMLNVGVTPSAPVAGQVVTLSATMNAAATGTFTFSDGSTVLAKVAVTSGAASFSTSSLAAGVHSLGFSYSGDATFMSSGTSFTQTILAASSIRLASSANPSTSGQSVSFTAVVTPSTATGTVQFLDSGTVIGTASLSSGATSFSTASLTKGTHSISATYSGDSADSPAASALLTQVVKGAASVSLASSLNPSTVSQSVSFSARLTPSTATGTIQFLDGSTVLSTVTLSSGSALFATSQLGAGTHSITALYSGDNSDTAGTSAVLTQTVNVAPPGAPSNLTATAAGSSQINLTWTASATSGVTYDVYESASPGFTPSASNRIASNLALTTYSNTGLSPSTTHHYRVTAVNAGGESAATNQANATTTGVMACHISYSVSNQWNVGFGGAISIQNTGAIPINSWTLTWTWPGNQRATQSWNSNFTQSGANVTFTNLSYNATIAPGATLTGVGFNASYSGSNPAPTAFSVNGTLCH